MSTTNGVPAFKIIFQTLKALAIQSQANRKCGLILIDATVTTFDTKTYYDLSEVKATDWTAQNYKYIELAFKGNPYSIEVYRMDVADPISDALTHFSLSQPNYLALPGNPAADITSAISWVKSKRNDVVNPKQIKLVVGDEIAPDHEGIINWCTNNVVVGGVTYTAEEYTACICGILSGVSENSSVTNYEMPWVTSADLSVDETLDIQNGKLIATKNESGVYKIVRGVNSLVTLSITKGNDFTKIRLIDIMDKVAKDIRTTYKNFYEGKIENIYEFKMLFCNAVNGYLLGLMNQRLLDSANDNKIDVNTEKHKEYLTSNGKTAAQVAAMTESELREVNTGSNLFVSIKDFKPVDVMEDADFIINL